jgi:hypothetical protein
MGLSAGSTIRTWGALCRRIAIFATWLAMAACSTATETAPDAPNALKIVNRGSNPIHCMINFGHWVTRDLGVIEENGAKTVRFHRQPADGALYIPREDGQRLMMIENIFCSAPGDAPASRGQVPLLAIQAGQSHHYSSICRAGEPVTCEAPGGD